METGISSKRSLADLMRYNANLTYLIKESVSSDGDLILNRLTNGNNLLYGINQNLLDAVGNQDNLTLLFKGLQQSITDWANHWWYDFYLLFVEWGKAWEARPPVAVDLSGVEDKLQKLINMQDGQGVVDNIGKMIDALVGDLDFSNLAAMSSEVETALSSAFPFCVPAVMKQVLGLVRAEPEAPVWEFDIAGSPLVVDFAPFRPVADVMGWCLRVGFALVLLANTRKFVYMGGGATDA